MANEKSIYGAQHDGKGRSKVVIFPKTVCGCHRE